MQRTLPAREDDAVDRELVREALRGEARAFDDLVRRHQAAIHALALRMLWSPPDADDATQEILVKVMTGLASFRGDSAFRTWVHRVAANHLLNRRRSRVEEAVGGFDDVARWLDRAPDGQPDGDPAERRLLEEQTRASCLLGLLLCLDRTQRLVFVLGEILEVGEVAGSEILGVTRPDFRQRLARARRELFAFMGGRCGLADPRNPCRCARKTRAAIAAGLVDPERQRFMPARVATAERAARRHARDLAGVAAVGYGHLFRDHASRADPPDLVARIRAVLADGRLRAMLELDGGGAGSVHAVSRARRAPGARRTGRNDSANGRGARPSSARTRK